MELALDAELETDGMYAALNKHREFWRVYRYALQSTFFIMLGRVFDGDGGVLSLHRRLNALMRNPELFSKSALRARQIALHRGAPDRLEDLVNKAWEPGPRGAF